MKSRERARALVEAELKKSMSRVGVYLKVGNREGVEAERALRVELRRHVAKYC